MTLLKLFKKNKEEPARPEAKPPDFKKQVDELLESARGKDAVGMWEISYTTSLDSEHNILLEGTTIQVLKWLAERQGTLRYYYVKLLPSPRLLR